MQLAHILLGIWVSLEAEKGKIVFFIKNIVIKRTNSTEIMRIPIHNEKTIYAMSKKDILSVQV